MRAPRSLGAIPLVAGVDGDRANDLLLLDDARAEVMFQSAPGVFLPPRALH